MNSSLKTTDTFVLKNNKKPLFRIIVKVFFVFLSFILLAFIVLYGIFLVKKTNAESITQKTILTQISKSINLPDDFKYILRVSDNKDLELEDILYKGINIGDYIIVYSSMVIVYDFDKNFIKNIKTY